MLILMYNNRPLEVQKMLSVTAYYDGSNYVTEETVMVKPNQKVIITYLDDSVQTPQKKSLAEIRSYMRGGKSVPEGISAVDYVRELRADNGKSIF